ncbi:MAG: metallopeptidase family protein [Candidatus Saccharibacteria bacterium]|nr:MAG: metallopeptidase family protein [Candidatus Saccharibacteria bacterium]
MIELTDERFDQLITRAMDELPQKYITGLENVAIIYEDEPSSQQKEKMKLDNNHLLLGLYEGIPLTHRGNGYSFVLPDKITLFKHSILAVVQNEEELFEQIKRTLWHEIAHYYGLDHARIEELQARDR